MTDDTEQTEQAEQTKLTEQNAQNKQTWFPYFLGSLLNTLYQASFEHVKVGQTPNLALLNL